MRWSATKSPGSSLRAKAPRVCIDDTRTVDVGGAPTSPRRSRTATPVHVASRLQPSTHAMGRRWVRCGRASRSARESDTTRPPNRTLSTKSGEVAASTAPAARAVRLTGRPCGPEPSRTANTDTRRSQGTLWPTVSTVATTEAPTAVASTARRPGPPPSATPPSATSTAGSSGARASRITGSFTATCTRMLPTATQATASWVGRNENAHGYHCTTLSTPVTRRKIADATSSATDPRSSTCSASRRRPVGGRWRSRGNTDQSLTSSSGTHAMPVATCSPCVQRYSDAGVGPMGAHAGGSYCRWLQTPVRKQTPKAMPSQVPTRAVRRGPRARAWKSSTRGSRTRRSLMASAWTRGAHGTDGLRSSTTQRPSWRSVRSCTSPARSAR